MPSSDSAPNFALMAEVDIRSLSGITLYTRGTTAITISMASIVYEDMISLMSGHGSRQTIDDTIDYYATVAGSASAGSWFVYFGTDDKLQLRANRAFDVSLTSGPDYLGIGAGTVSSIAAGAFHIASMPLDWTRGRVQGPMVLNVDPTGEPAFTVTIDGEYQDLRVAIREAGSMGDADDINASISLSARDTDENSLTGLNSIRWLIDEEGHSVCSYPSSVSVISVWNSALLRNLLGFTGNEAPTTPAGSSYDRLRSSYPCATVLVPTRPVERHQLTSDTRATLRRTLGGSMSSNRLATYTRSRLEFYLDAAADARDLYQHFTERFASYTGPGLRLTYYGELGDSRRHSAPMSLNSSYQMGNYDSLYTIENERGRYIGRLVEGSFNLNYPTRLRRRVPLAVTIEHDGAF